MDCIKVGALIRTLRLEKAMTQRQLADMMNISDKTVSKWERGCGLPDVSVLNELSDILRVDISKMLGGELPDDDITGGNMKKAKYYVCSACGNITVCTGQAQVTCCGRKLAALEPKKAEDGQKLSVQDTDGSWFITSRHEMTKDNYISFIALATGDKIQIYKQYAEWDASAHILGKAHGMLLWYSTDEGLLYQYI